MACSAGIVDPAKPARKAPISQVTCPTLIIQDFSSRRAVLQKVQTVRNAVEAQRERIEQLQAQLSFSNGENTRDPCKVQTPRNPSGSLATNNQLSVVVSNYVVHRPCKVEYVRHAGIRRITERKRSANLMAKAQEVHVLTGAPVLAIYHSCSESTSYASSNDAAGLVWDAERASAGQLVGWLQEQQSEQAREIKELEARQGEVTPHLLFPLLPSLLSPLLFFSSKLSLLSSLSCLFTSSHFTSLLFSLFLSLLTNAVS